MGAHDDDARTPGWDPHEELVRDAAAQATPTLGICLGHQLVAVALGGRGGPNPRGQQLGLLPLGWTDAAGQDDLTRGLVGTGCRCALERRRRAAVAGGHGGPRADSRAGSSRWRGSPRRCGASSCTRRSTRTSSRPGPRRTAIATPKASSTRCCTRSPSSRGRPGRRLAPVGAGVRRSALTRSCSRQRLGFPAWASRKTSFSAHSKSATSGSCGCGSPTCSATSSLCRSPRPSWRTRSPRASGSTARRSRDSPGSPRRTCWPTPTRRRSSCSRGVARVPRRRGCSATS